MQTQYQITSKVNGDPLTAQEIRARYRRPAKGNDNRSYQHIIDILEQVERRYHPGDRVEIVLTYRINGKAPKQWHYRQP